MGTWVASFQKSDGTNVFKIREGNGGIHIGSQSGYIAPSDFEGPVISGSGFLFFGNGFSKNDASSYAAVTITTNSSNNQIGSGTINMLNINSLSYNPSSGTGAFNFQRIAGPVNQTSTASGAITLFNLQPTYTSVKGTLTGIWYHPSYTSITGADRFIIDESTTALSGIGGVTSPTAFWHIGAGSTTIAPFQINSSGSGITGLLTTALKGAVEFSDYGLWFSPAASTRHKVLHGLTGASAPSTSSLTAFVNYYGTGGTVALSTPTTWISVVGDDGVTYKIPAY